MGGLAAAIRLAAAGFEVEVFEKNEQVGGRVGRLEAEGFTFDTGPSLLLMTDTYRELFRSAGRDLDDYVKLMPLDANYRVTFGTETPDHPAHAPRAHQGAGAHRAGVTPRFYRFLEDACHKYRLGRSEFVERDFEKAGDFFGVRNLRLLLKTKAVNNYYRRVSKYFASTSCGRRFPCRPCTSASPPSRRRRSTRPSPTPSWPKTACGSRRADVLSISAMERLGGELGVSFHLDSPVERVVVTKGRATGVRVNGGSSRPTPCWRTRTCRTPTASCLAGPPTATSG